MKVPCYECGSIVVVVMENGKLYYSAHYIPGGVDSRGFCLNTKEVTTDLFRVREVK